MNTESLDGEADPGALSPNAAVGAGLNSFTWAAAGSLAKWVGEKAAAGIVGKVAGDLFGMVMSEIGLGGPDLAKKLDEISDQLVEVQRSLDRLTAMTAELLKQLGELKEFIEKTFKLESLAAAMNRIDVAYGPAAPAGSGRNDTGRAISLRLLVEKMPHFDGITPKELQDAAKDFAAYVSDMPDCIETIHRALAKTAFDQSSLLTLWANELARKVNEKKIEREAAYLVMEGYFLQAVAAQLKGVSVHCVALGADKRLGPQFIREFLEDNFAKTVASETAAFVEAVERLFYLTVVPTMQTSLQDGLGEREFPKQIDALLLRADLIAAALNLVGNKPQGGTTPWPSIQAAIQGIYGRAVMRPSDLNNGNPPALTLAGYAAGAGKNLRTTPLPCLDLVIEEGRVVLKDPATTLARQAHYFWRFATPEPVAGTAIDRSQRGGVTPARYPVFGADQPTVLAAGVLDVSRLYRGVPAGTPHVYNYTKFPSANPDIGYYDQRCSPKQHALGNAPNDVVETFFTYVHIYRPDIGESSWVLHPLFHYTGGAAKVRLTAHIASILYIDKRKDAEGGTAFSQWWELWNRLRLRHSKGLDQEFYNSVDGHGTDKPLSINGSPAYSAFQEKYECRRDGHYSIEINLEPGDYTLVLQLDAACHHSRRYEGWQGSSLAFYIHGVALERVG